MSFFVRDAELIIVPDALCTHVEQHTTVVATLGSNLTVLHPNIYLRVIATQAVQVRQLPLLNLLAMSVKKALCCVLVVWTAVSLKMDIHNLISLP